MPLCVSCAYPNHQLSDVVNGLFYLHSSDVIHGNLKGVRGDSHSGFYFTDANQSNVLVDATGRARITDFYFATVITDMDSELGHLFRQCCTQRWTAPEVLKGGIYSEEADIFSLAMVMVEVRHGSFAARGGLTTVPYLYTDLRPRDSLR